MKPTNNTTDTTIYRIYDNYDGETRYVHLTPDQVNLMCWLEEKGFLRSEVEFEASDLPKVESI